ncbi:MAG: carboxymuconolactone decarboxylase family protein [Klebsiella pneumoniae]|nr:carboxymuconolactone decarboxylase family protein [Klebsiella pneumoniae]
MKNVIAAAALSLVLSDFTYAHEQRDEAMMKITPSTLADADIQAVSPALARFGREAISNDLWQRDALSARDRSIVTVAMLIARNQPGELKHYIAVALDSGVTPAEVSEIITHLTAEALPAASPTLLPLNEQVEKQRADTVEKNVGPISPGLVKFTADPLFLDLWQRPALTPRDRSLVTVSALIAAGQSAQIGYHLNRAMDNGLSAEEAGEVVAQAAFYAGWPNAFTAAPVVGEVLRARESKAE